MVRRVPTPRVTFVLLVALCLTALLPLVSQNWTVWGAAAADPLREWLGNETVAWVEGVLFRVQDEVQQRQYALSQQPPETPWELVLPTPTPSPTVTPTATRPRPTLTRPASGSTPTPLPPTATPHPTATATPTPWQPAAAAALGQLEGEGIWSPYLFGEDNQAVAYRTFFQPDPERPFALVAVVAIDLSQTQLHFVLGSEEPSQPDGPRGRGQIPTEHKDTGILLATFNGGFKATHGQFGAMADGIEALPPQDGLATVGLYRDGQIKIGAWGMDIVPDDHLIAWRQNAPLIIDKGEMTEAARRNSMADWSGSVHDEIVTWRSGLGLSADGQILYYFAGPSLHMPSLAQTMLAVGVEQGMLLDINPSWVQFSAITAEAEELVATPLLAEMPHPDRYLNRYGYERDFFYLTVANHPIGD